MDFERPLLLLAVLAVILLGLGLAAALRRRKRRLASLADPAVWGAIAPEAAWGRQAARVALWTGGAACLALALARPRWGEEWQEFRRRGLDIVIALDTSKSMLAEDVKPNRLERAKLGVQDLLARLKGDRVGLVVFAGSSFTQCPLTVDYAAFQLNLEDVRAGMIPRGGSDIRGAVDEVIQSFATSKGSDKVAILISDGEDHDPAPDAITAKLKEAGVKLFSIGVGSADGELIPVRDEQGRTQFLKGSNDQVVKSSLNESFLGRIAVDSGGAYIKALPTDFGIEKLYDEVILKLKREESNSRLVKRRKQQFPWLIGAGLMFLAIEAALPARKRRKS
jgi:Ca-activated chloride channel family protein